MYICRMSYMIWNVACDKSRLQFNNPPPQVCWYLVGMVARPVWRCLFHLPTNPAHSPPYQIIDTATLCLAWLSVEEMTPPPPVCSYPLASGVSAIPSHRGGVGGMLTPAGSLTGGFYSLVGGGIVLGLVRWLGREEWLLIWNMLLSKYYDVFSDKY